MIAARRILGKPITWLLAAALVAALFVFRDYGLTWDEPLFYQYGDAVGYAYSPTNWFSGAFDLANAYGPSADDHKTRGPGYLILARLPVAALTALGMEAPSAWHLINFATFLFGVYCIYGLASCFAGDVAATLGAAVFATQPMLWGHAFINPKDMPFLVFFAAAVWLGMRAADRLVEGEAARPFEWVKTLLLPAFLLGLASANRVLGPLAGILVGIYLLSRRPRWSTLAWLAAYGVGAAAVMIALWPYLWESPIRFAEVFALMADNPTSLPVLFANAVYRADGLPLRYLPFHLLAGLTELVWPLFAAGVLYVMLRRREAPLAARRAILLLGWLAVPVAYVLLRRPPMYDGMRHFLFTLPPVFIVAAAGLEWSLQKLRAVWMRAALAGVVLLPGVIGIVTLHPYEYGYFNTLVGGTTGVFRRYETEYWLTCYKEAVEDLNSSTTEPVRLYVHREASVASPYAAANVEVLDARGARNQIRSGDLVLVSTRTNEDRRVYRGAPEIIQVGRAGAIFCVIKQVP